MKFLVLAALPALVAAQAYGPPSPASSASSSAASSSAAPAVPTAGPGQHVIQVGGSTPVFSPSTITANENETVIFYFMTTAGSVLHSVTQSTFANPCELAPGGFDSGLQGTGATYTIQITNASQPIWFYCQQTSPLKHCNIGMVGGINVAATGDHDITAFMAAASTASDPTQTGSGILSGIGAVATAPATTSSAAPATSSSSSSSSSGAMRLVAGAGSLLAGLFAAVYTLA